MTKLLEDYGIIGNGETLALVALRARSIGFVGLILTRRLAWYGTLRTWTNEHGLKDAVRLVEAVLEDEKKTDAILTKLAETLVNQESA